MPDVLSQDEVNEMLSDAATPLLKCALCKKDFRTHDVYWVFGKGEDAGKRYPVCEDCRTRLGMEKDERYAFTPKEEVIEKVEPAHYRQGDIECIDAIKAAIVNLSGEEAYCTGNAIKYLWRWRMKDGKTDLAKAMWYIGRML